MQWNGRKETVVTRCSFGRTLDDKVAGRAWIWHGRAATVLRIAERDTWPGSLGEKRDGREAMEEAMRKLRLLMGCAMRRLVKVLVVVLGVVIVAEVAETVLMTWGLRSGNSRVIRLVTWYHKHVTNPVMVRFFSGRSVHAALLHHVGRRSGKAYLTPLTAHRSEDTIIVPLPYGTKVDWLRNLQTAGRGVVELDGRRVTVDEPEVVPVDRVISLLPPFVTRLVRLHDTKEALQLHVVEPA